MSAVAVYGLCFLAFGIALFTSAREGKGSPQANFLEASIR
jgi:hypothetical protein